MSSHKAKTFGWQSFHFEFPENWQLAAEGGDSRSGSLRFEGDISQFELKWEPNAPAPIGKKLAQELPELADRFVQQLKKSEKTVICGKGTARIQQHEAHFVHFKTDVEGYAFFWYCIESSRLLVGQFTSKRSDRESKSVMKKVLKSLRCHGLDQNVWALLGFFFKTPKSFKLMDRKMIVGKTSLSLVEEERQSPFADQKTEILFEYFSMANVRFEATYLKPKKWIDEYYFGELKKRYRGIQLEASRSRHINGHRVAVKKGSASSGLTLRRKALFIVASWHCQDMNRMYSVTISKQIVRPILFQHKIDEGDLKKCFKDFFSSISCH